jgi:succinoglycan biosynthesis transport protein ExoP
VTTAKAERLKIETERAQLKQMAAGPPERMLAMPSVAVAPEVADLQRKIADKEAEIATLSRRYKAEHPKYIAAVSSLSELKTSRDQAILKAGDLVNTAFEAAQTTEKKLEEALREQESLALELSKITISYSSLSREVESDRALYQSLLARLKETDVAQGVAQYAIRIDTPAALPQLPVWPRKSIVLLLAFCGGIALSLTYVLGRHALDTSLTTVDEAERVIGLPSLGAIPKQSRKTKLEDARRFLVQAPHSPLAEAFRTLRTTLLLADKEDSQQTVLFASAIPGEGKSFCSINYAVSLAQQGFRTLLVDADLRLPNVGRIFLGRRKALGMTDVLRARCEFDDAVHPTDIENLSVLPSGARLANSAELIGNANLPEFLQAANARFDYIVIDTAPVLAASETALLVPHVDTICLVVRAARTPSAVVLRALQKLQDSGAHVAGLVLNGLPAKGGYYYHYQSPEYGRYEVESRNRTVAER